MTIQRQHLDEASFSQADIDDFLMEQVDEQEAPPEFDFTWDFTMENMDLLDFDGDIIDILPF